MSGIITAAGISAAAGLASGLLQGGGSGGTQTQTQQTYLPGGIQQRESDNYDLAMQTANQLMGPYQGQRVADLTPEQRNLISQLYGNVGSTNAAFANAQGVTNGLMGYNPLTITPQTLAGTNLAPYMNPYTQSVIDPTMAIMEQSRRQALTQIGDQAAQAKAFGGSRQGISEGVTNAQSELAKGQFAGNLWNQNFLNAQNQAVGDIQRNLQAQQSNQQYDLLGAQLRGQMARQGGDLAQAQQNNWLAGVNAALGGQQMLQANEQAKLDAARQLYMEQRQQPLDVLQIRQNALAQAQPWYSPSMTTTGPGPSTNPMLTGLGTASTLLGMYGTLNKAGAFGGTRPTNTAGLTTDEVMKIATG